GFALPPVFCGSKALVQSPSAALKQPPRPSLQPPSSDTVPETPLHRRQFDTRASPQFTANLPVASFGIRLRLRARRNDQERHVSDNVYSFASKRGVMLAPLYGWISLRWRVILSIKPKPYRVQWCSLFALAVAHDARD